jgi:Fe-S-cluster containining protein
MRDGPGRRALKLVARWRFALDVRAARALWRARGGVEFELAGACRRCARCCEAPAVRSNLLVWRLRSVRALFLWWQRRVNGFELTAVDRETRTFVFRCTHFDGETRSCDSYASRPGMCRDYPRALLFQPAPELLEGCGYRARDRNAARFLRVLDGQPLTEEQREKLRRGLHLE